MLNKLRPGLAALAAAFMLFTGGAHAQTGSPVREPETRDRVPEEALAALTAGPTRLIAKGRIAEAERMFEALLRRQRPGTAAVADHLTSFGLAFFGAEDEALRARSIPYFRRAVEAARSAFGPAHPEFALALTTLADAQFELQPDDPPAEADAALGEAHRIRVAALGPRNIETLATLLKMAQIAGLPARTRGDPARIAAAATLYRQALATSDNRRGSAYSYDYNDFSILLDLAFTYARNADANAALGAAGEAIAAFARSRPGDPDDPCFAFQSRVLSVLSALLDNGGKAEADLLEARAERELGACGVGEEADFPERYSAIATVLSSV